MAPMPELGHLGGDVNETMSRPCSAPDHYEDAEEFDLFGDPEPDDDLVRWCADDTQDANSLQERELHVERGRSLDVPWLLNTQPNSTTSPRQRSSRRSTAHGCSCHMKYMDETPPEADA